MPKYLKPDKMPEHATDAIKIAQANEENKLLNRDEKKEYAKLRELLMCMSPFQIGFVEGYVKTASASQAARMAGSKSERPEVIGYKTLQDPRVQMAIAIAMKKRIEAVGLDTLEVVVKIRAVYDQAMEAGKFDAAIKACELLQKEIDKASKAVPSKVGNAAVGESKPVYQEDGVNMSDELERVVSIIGKKRDTG